MILIVFPTIMIHLKLNPFCSVVFDNLFEYLWVKKGWFVNRLHACLHLQIHAHFPQCFVLISETWYKCAVLSSITPKRKQNPEMIFRQGKQSLTLRTLRRKFSFCFIQNCKNLTELHTPIEHDMTSLHVIIQWFSQILFNRLTNIDTIFQYDILTWYQLYSPI